MRTVTCVNGPLKGKSYDVPDTHTNLDRHPGIEGVYVIKGNKAHYETPDTHNEPDDEPEKNPDNPRETT